MRALKVRGQVRTNRGGVAASSARSAAGSAASLRRRTRERRSPRTHRPSGTMRPQRGHNRRGSHRQQLEQTTPRLGTRLVRQPSRRLSQPSGSHRRCLANAFQAPEALTASRTTLRFLGILETEFTRLPRRRLQISGREQLFECGTTMTPAASLPF